jgi:polyferredoxin
MKKRRLSQIGSFFALSLGSIFQAKWLCLPILHCHSCPIASFSCPIGVLGHYLSIGVFPFFLIGTMLLFGALLGRAMCGWVCPFGLLQELLHRIPSPKLELWPPLRFGKYLSLFLLVLAAPVLLGTESFLYFCRLCPAAAIEASLPYAYMQGGFTDFWGPFLRFSILGAVLLASVFVLRFFCRTLCPVGAITAILNSISAFSLRHDADACPQCGECARACPVGVDLQEESRSVMYKAPADCILCLECTKACPTSDGLKGSFAGNFRRTDLSGSYKQ